MSYRDGVKRHKARVAKHLAKAKKRFRGRRVKLVGLTNLLRRSKTVKSVRRKA